MKVRLHRLASAAGMPLPEPASAGSAGVDLRAALDEPLTLAPGERRLVPTGLVLEIPAGWEGQVRPRSGLALRHGITVANAPGTIDSDYRGEVRVILVNLGQETFTVERGHRIAQLLLQRAEPLELVEVEEAGALSGSARGSGGFGSTGLA